ncbi:unnamed protein product, partial [Brassica oleracea]
MEPTPDFDTGEESIITLEYERLGNHCTYCFRLSHLQSQCPEKPSDAANTHTDNGVAPMQRTKSLTARRSPLRESREHIMPQNRLFQQRYDHRGRPFGERISAAAPRPTGPRNKLAPPAQPAIQTAANEISAPPNEQREHAYYSPPYSRRRLHQNGGEHQQEDRDNRRNSPRLQWKAKSTLADQEATSQRRSSHSPRPSLGRNLDRTDFPPLNEGIANATTVMEELREVTLQYLNVDDPTERAARQQRVLQSELDGTVEETAVNIIQASTNAALASPAPTNHQDTAPFSQTTSPSNGGVNPVRRRGRPARSGASRTHVRLSPKVYAGMGSKKRNLNQLQTSPGTSKAQAPKPTRKQRRTTASTAPPITLIPPRPNSGGLALFWKQDIDLQILSSSKNVIDTIINYKGSSFFATFVYGDPETQHR